MEPQSSTNVRMGLSLTPLEMGSGTLWPSGQDANGTRRGLLPPLFHPVTLLTASIPMRFQRTLSCKRSPPPGPSLTRRSNMSARARLAESTPVSGRRTGPSRPLRFFACLMDHLTLTMHGRVGPLVLKMSSVTRGLLMFQHTLSILFNPMMALFMSEPVNIQ